MKELNDKEIKLAISKIKSKYEQIVKEFRKSRAIIESFEERYIKVLKNKMNISVFLLAEIEAVEELYNKELVKKQIEERDKVVEKKEPNQSFADKVFNDNRQKISKYPKMNLGNDADEEVERLLGAVRDLINNYWQALSIIYKEKKFSVESESIIEFYHKLISNYDYTGDFPIARRYSEALQRKPKDFKKIDYEHRFILQETAFLLNSIYDTLESIIQNNSIPDSDKKLNAKISTINKETWFYEYFNNLSHKESVLKISGYLNDVINDFRFKGIKRSYK